MMTAWTGTSFLFFVRPSIEIYREKSRLLKRKNRMHMELQGIARDEIAPFFTALGHEKELVMITLDSLMSCDFIAGIRSHGELAGLTGIRLQYGFIPSVFIVVKDKYQGMGLGNKLVEKNVSFARKQYDLLTLATWDRKEYEAAIHLYNKHGFRIFNKRGGQMRMCICFNRKGRFIQSLLPLIYSVSPALNRLLPAVSMV